ncbi:unnamed protein product, partial [Lampetra planeri]
EKHHIEADVRQKKQELEQERLRLQQLKKTSLRERWLLQDDFNTSDASEELRRKLEVNIHRWVLSSAPVRSTVAPPTPTEAPPPSAETTTPYSILSVMDTTEPITAVFMGFQTAQDDSRS